MVEKFWFWVINHKIWCSHGKWGWIGGMSDVRHDAEKGRFEREFSGRMAVLDYHIREGRMVITHTFVPPEMRGGGIAGELVKRALEHARAEGLRVVPQCSYVDAYLRRHPEYASLRAT
ncbi:MAG TPA: GNAT family N-acetyltransferase [Chthoniobacterales bacterium]